MRNITNIPAPRVAFIDDRTGLMSREWYRFFLNLFVLTGNGNSDITVEDLQKYPITDVVVPVVDVIPITNTVNDNTETQLSVLFANNVIFDNTETQLAALSAKYDEISDRLEDLQLSIPPAGSDGTVTKVSVATANGFAGTVANATTTPEITLSTTETGILTGNGTSVSNAVIGTGLQYAFSTLSINATTGTEILRGNGSGQFSNITVGTGMQYASNTLSVKGLTGGTAIQYENGSAGFAPVTIGTGLSFVGGTLSSSGTGGGTVTNVSVVSANGLAGTVANPTTTPAITLSTTQNGVLTGNGTSISTAVIGSGLSYASSTLSVNATTGTDILRGNGSGQFSNITVGTGLQYSSSTLSVKGLTSTLDTILASDGTGGVKSISIGTGLSYSAGTLSSSGTGGGTVTNVSVVSANGLAGTVANPTTTPAITLSTNQTGVLTGNGTSISAATIGTGLQYSSGTLSVKGLPSSVDTILASDGTGGVKSVIIGTGLSYASGTLSSSGTGGGTVTNVSVVSANGLAGTVANPTTTPAITLSTSVNGIVKGNGTTLSAATAGTDYIVPGGALGTPSSGTATNLTGLPLTTGVTGLLPIANGGTGTATPALVAGSNVTITGSWPNQTITSTAAGGGGGTVTNVSVVSANGLAGTVANPTTTPAITLSTTANGLLTGNGTSISAATIGSGLSYSAGTLSATGGTGTVTSVSVVSANGLSGTVANATTTPAITLSTTQTGVLTGNGTSISTAVIGTGLQYSSSTLSVNATTGTDILRGNGSGQFANVSIGTGLQYASSTISIKGLTSTLDTILASDGTGGVKSISVGTGLSYASGTLSSTVNGTVTHTAGSLTANSVVVGNGTADVKTLDNVKVFASDTNFLGDLYGKVIYNYSGSNWNPTCITGGSVYADKFSYFPSIGITSRGSASDLWSTYIQDYYSVAVTNASLYNSHYNTWATTVGIPTSVNGTPLQSSPSPNGSWNDPGVVPAGNFVVGHTYQITLSGSTNFVAIGAANNNVGTIFVATGIGSGTGNALDQAPFPEADPYYTEIGGYAVTLGIGTKGNYAEGIGVVVKDSPAFEKITAGSFVIGQIYKIDTVGTTNFVAIGATSNTVGIVFTATGIGSGTGVAILTVEARLTGLQLAVQKDNPNNTWKSLGYAAYSSGAQQTTYAPLAAFSVAGGWQYGLDLSTGSYNGASINFPTSAIATGTSTGTYVGTNKPGANSTNVWLVVKVNGTDYYLPAWT